MKQPHGRTPATLMVWTLTDQVIESRQSLESQFHEIRSMGFGGVAPYVRCSRYAWSDPAARKALAAVTELCGKHGMACWIGPDPRFVSRQLIGEGWGVEVILFGNRARADLFPNTGRLSGGRFSVRCDLSPRHVHTLNEVAIEYAPRGVARAFALRLGEGHSVPTRVLDVSGRTRFFYHARDHYVEAFGSLPELDEGSWVVLPFFRAATNHVDFGSPTQMRAYHAFLAQLRREGCHPDGVMWDEPGYTCTYGTLPCSGAIGREYRRTAGRELWGDLWKLAFEAEDGSHVTVRNAFYASVQRTMNRSNLATTRFVRKLWGGVTVSGIHDTWHFESADMCDMNHGSMDLWQGMRAKTGGFVDLGGIEKLRDSASPWYAHLAAMSVICSSLGKMSEGGYAYNNLWTVGDDNGEGGQRAAMNHCVEIMALFGTRWLAHAYGPVGTIGEEKTFLGSPPLPGYPDHSTWRHFPGWNSRMAQELGAVEGRLPEAKICLIYPVETLYALGGTEADTVAQGIFELTLELLDHHHHVDIHAPSLCMRGRWSGGEFVLGSSRYDLLMLPSALVIPEHLSSLLRAGRERVLFVGELPQRTSRGKRIPLPAGRQRWEAVTPADALVRLNAIPALRPVNAPEGTWVTMTRLGRGTMVSVAPARCGFRYSGPLAYGGVEVDLPERAGLTRILFRNL
jgi:hypothetical protein